MKTTDTFKMQRLVKSIQMKADLSKELIKSHNNQTKKTYFYKGRVQAYENIINLINKNF